MKLTPEVKTDRASPRDETACKWLLFGAIAAKERTQAVALLREAAGA